MRRRHTRSEELWRAFLRTSSGRQLVREGVIRHTPWERRPRPLPAKTKLWLAVLVILGLLAMVLGGWIAETTRNQKWFDDDKLLPQDTTQHSQARIHYFAVGYTFSAQNSHTLGR
jgi:hypothetical protein